MKNVKWSVYQGSRHVDSGTVLAKDDREVLRRLLARDLGVFEPVPEKCYRLSAGDAMASAYGDEFERTCHAVGDPDGLPGEATIEEHAMTGGFLFDDPPTRTGSGAWDQAGSNPLGDVKRAILEMDPMGCPKGGPHDMNADHVDVDTGKVHPECRKCGLVSPVACRDATRDEVRQTKMLKGMVQGAVKGLVQSVLDEVLARNPGQDVLDVDRAREERQLVEQIHHMVAADVISPEEGGRLVQGVLAGAELPEIPLGVDPRRYLGHLGKRAAQTTCDEPRDHRLMKRRDSYMNATVYCCSRCGRKHAVSDQQMVSAIPGFDWERAVREALTA